MNNKLNCLIATASIMVTSSSFAEESKLTGSISLDLNSNFISYGTAIWDDSDDLTARSRLIQLSV